MPSPFPGFDPFLQGQKDWSSFHSDFIVDIKRILQPELPPGFDARTNAHVSIVFPELRKFGKNRTGFREPDVAVFGRALSPVRETSGAATLDSPRVTPSVRKYRATVPEIVPAQQIRQYYLEIRDMRGDQEQVIAVIELLSPTNKDGRGGSADYRRKQSQILETDVHLLEIDLLRGGEHVVFVPREEIEALGAYDYVVALSQSDAPDEFQVWRVGLRDPLPTVLVPLTPDVAPVELALQTAFERCYDASYLARGIDYHRDPAPPLSPADAAWADAMLRAGGQRP